VPVGPYKYFGGPFLRIAQQQTVVGAQPDAPLTILKNIIDAMICILIKIMLKNVVLPVKSVQACRSTHPQIPLLIFKDIQNIAIVNAGRVGLLVFIMFESVTVVSVKPVVTAKPHESLFIHQNGPDM